MAATAHLDADIMKRRAPSMRHQEGRANMYATTVTGRRRHKPYALKARRRKQTRREFKSVWVDGSERHVA